MPDLRVDLRWQGRRSRRQGAGPQAFHRAVGWPQSRLSSLGLTSGYAAGEVP